MKLKWIIPLFGIAASSVLTSWLLYPDFMSDDAFIHIGFIEGLIKNGGFTFAGNRTYGITAPLWVILGAVFVEITTLPSVIGIRVMSCLFTFLSILLLAFLLYKEKVNPLLVLCATLSLAFNVYVQRWYLTGMECGAAMLLLTLSLYYHRRPDTSLNAVITGLALGCASLVRPEIILFFIIFSLWRTLFSHKAAHFLLYAISGFCPLLLWNLYAYFYFGTMTPNSFIVKANKSIFDFNFEHSLRTVKLVISGSLPEFLLICVTFVIMLRVFLKHKRCDNSFFKQKDLGLVVICFFGFYAYYIFKDVIVISRYSMILFPFIIYFTAVTANHVLTSSKIKTYLVVCWAVSIIVFNAIFTFMVIKPGTNQFSTGFQSVYMEMAAILKQKPPNSSVGLTDVGIIGTYSGLKIVDFAGLVDHRRFNYNTLNAYIEDRKPDFILLRDEYQIENLLPEQIPYTLISHKRIPALGINETKDRNVRLWEISW